MTRPKTSDVAFVDLLLDFPYIPLLIEGLPIFKKKSIIPALRNVHLQLDADTFSPLQRRYDAKEVLGTRVPTRAKHPLQAG
jgi:hypothetical protein